MDPDWVPSASRSPISGETSRRRSARIQAAQTGALYAYTSDDENAESKDSDDEELGNSEKAIDTFKTSAGLGPAPEPLSPRSDPSTPRDDVPERVRAQITDRVGNAMGKTKLALSENSGFADDGGKSQTSEGFVHNQDENLSKVKGIVTSDMSALGAIHPSDHTNSRNTVSAQSLPRKSRSQPVALPLESTPPGYIVAGYVAAVTESTAQETPKPHECSDTLTQTKYIQEFTSRAEAIVDRILHNGPPEQKEVLEYLLKKGYTKSEAMLRMESAAQDADGRPLQPGTEDLIGAKYRNAFTLMREWIETCLDLYKADLRRVQWPVFVYSFLKLVANDSLRDSRAYFATFKDSFEAEHPDDLRALEPISLLEHLENNETAKIYRNNKYRLRMSDMAFNLLILFLESKEKEGGRLLIALLNEHIHIVTFERSADNEQGIAKLLNRAKANEDFPAEDEGIPGHNPGSANTEQAAGSNVLTRLKLGPLPMEPDLFADVRGDLEDEDSKSPPAEGQLSLVQHFDQQIKREESEDAPTRAEIPLPASTARDVAMEVQKVKENRDRFKIEGRTGGVGPGVSVVMFTFHNTYDGITCLDFSQDNTLIAAGMDQSYIRVWTVSGEALPASDALDAESRPAASCRLIGHSGCVYAVSFSPSATPSGAPNSAGSLTTSKHLLSCSADKSVRLWSLESWTCLVVYKGHNDIVWDVKWGPFGHYFVTGSHDRTARLWATNEISFLRIFVGHDKDVDVVCFHPNNAYVFTGSCDRMVRMWKVMDGVPVRMFTGHTGNITSLACSPSGKILASADDAGTIILWDLAPGRLLKRMRGHGKGGIWSLSWSAESTVLVSGGMDGTVRVWDIAVPNDANGQGRVIGEGGAGQKIDGNPQPPASGSGGAKKKGKEVIVTSDQISAFPTKKSPVYKVQFTRQNLVMAGGAYMP